MAPTAREISSRAWWSGINPSLTIDAPVRSTVSAPALPERIEERLVVDGYVISPHFFPIEIVESLRHGIETVRSAGLPPVFVFVFDAAWQLFQAAHPFVGAVLGLDFRVIPAFWAWYVDPSVQEAGWGAHRDNTSPCVDEHNRPQSLTVWVPVSDATPDNGCMYCVPASRDRRFLFRTFDGVGNAVVQEPQDVRAMPAPAASLLAWNQNLLHWGGRSSQFATGPRVSMAMEFQAAGFEPRMEPLLDPAAVPTFEARLQLIGRQIRQYAHMYAHDAEIVELANQLSPC